MRRPKVVDDCLDERIAVQRSFVESAGQEKVKSMSDADLKAAISAHAQKYVRYYILGSHTLISLIEDPNEEGILIICRDSTGKSGWRTKPVSQEVRDPLER